LLSSSLSDKIYNLLHNKFTPPTDKNARAQHLNMSRCWDVASVLSVGGEFVVQQVVELLWACPLVVLYNMSVAGVYVVEFGTYDVIKKQSSTDVFWIV